VRDCEVYSTCEAEEKLVPQFIDFVGADRIMISADMPHGEAREGSVQEIRERADLNDTVKQRLLGDNAAKFYAI
jgi:predicted TIM-barrel fold metal-dependent hydrolase